MAVGTGVLASIGVGANLGDARATIDSVFRELVVLSSPGHWRASSVYRSEPVDATGPDYLNAVVQVHTSLQAHELLAALQRIESAHGRERPYPNAPRTLDLDLLLYGDHHIDTPTLHVPHPRLHLRAFVLVPLAELQPDLVVPGQGDIAVLMNRVRGQRIDRLTP